MRRCPQCGASFPDEGRFCPFDRSPLPDPPRPVVRLSGRFLLEEEIGQGATAQIFRARHVSLARPFAAKLLRPEYCGDEKSLRRFLREALIVARIDHPNVVRVFDFGRTPRGQPYLILEHLTGVTLYDTIREAGRLPLPRTLHIVSQVAAALAHAHQRGVLHRDIKPENILLTQHGDEPDFVKILDFGLGKVFDLPALSLIGEVLGTPVYMAPEALTGSAALGPAADVYALGVLLHECLTGTPPFEGAQRSGARFFEGDIGAVLRQHQTRSPEQLSARCPADAAIPAALDALTQQMLARAPTGRPAAAEAARALTALWTEAVRESAGALALAELQAEAAEAQHRLELNREILRGRILNLEERRVALYESDAAADPAAINQEILELEQELDGVERALAWLLPASDKPPAP